MKKIIIALMAVQSVMAFEPQYIETKNFKVKTSKEYQRQNNPRYCRFQTNLDDSNKAIDLRIGVVGSPVDYFGWNMQIDLADLPLKEGYEKVFKSPGTTGMILTYKNGVLEFKRIKSEQVWNRLYPFSIKVGSNLDSPKNFKGSMEGFQRTALGSLKKHVVQSCNF
jgi:hypothetical protein